LRLIALTFGPRTITVFAIPKSELSFATSGRAVMQPVAAGGREATKVQEGHGMIDEPWLAAKLFENDVFTDFRVLDATLREEPAGSSAAWDAGRNIKLGYVRGVGIQSLKLTDWIRNDPDYRFAIEVMQGRSLVNEHSLFNLFLLIKYSPLRGNIIEFGSYRGGSALFMAALAKRLRPGCRVYGLDTFEGMPPVDDRVDVHVVGQFGDTNLAEIETICATFQIDNLTLIKGLFDEGIKRVPHADRHFFLKHIDCDIYASILSAIFHTLDYTTDYGYIVFDDPLYSTCLGAMKAIEIELVQKRGLHAEQVYPHLVYRNSPRR
jgi:hypothetical protein